MKTYTIILSENNVYSVKAQRLFTEDGFSILVDSEGNRVAVIPSHGCVICLEEIEA